MILACISQINSSKLLLPTKLFKFTTKKFSHLYSTSSKVAYLALSESANTLANKKLFINDPIENICREIKWIDHISYCSIKSKINLIFSSEIVHYLSGIKNIYLIGYEISKK